MEDRGWMERAKRTAGFQPAVSPISKAAGREKQRVGRILNAFGSTDGQRVWKPAIQQTWKSAVRVESGVHFHVGKHSTFNAQRPREEDGRWRIEDGKNARVVPQVSKPAVSPISKSAGREKQRVGRVLSAFGSTDGQRVWKPASRSSACHQQTWKSAVRLESGVHFHVAKHSTFNAQRPREEDGRWRIEDGKNARSVPQVSNLLYRRFPNRRGVENQRVGRVLSAFGSTGGQRVWKPAIQQTWKSAVRLESGVHFHVGKHSTFNAQLPREEDGSWR
jgi:hypothetical protein